jgi:predicted transcriptional regulator
MSIVQDYTIYQFLTKNNGKATIQEIIRALGEDEETKRIIEEKISNMARFGLITIEGDMITIKQGERAHSFRP